ncbi:MAG: transglutaminase-like enzyme predicted cysteine protease [Bryobacterales bacterium]|nr:transglutaminase-like enzyme predicted cysteine protease [Bryobacterales bacterium]
MIFTAEHSTTYLYSGPVSICHTEVHLAPRSGPSQTVHSHELEITPEPAYSVTREDYFGNNVTCFSIQEAHETLTVVSRSEVETLAAEPPCPDLTPAWEQVRDELKTRATDELFRASEFTVRSPMVRGTAEFADWARASFPPGRPIADACLELTHRIYTDFTYDPRATTISTPVEAVLKERKGVCQDFAHVMASCLRSMGLAARYVSGYLRSGEETRGAEASHAWCAVYCAQYGWLEFDPTNDLMPRGEHVMVAWGRDYSDVTPVRGVAIGGGEQLINVSVSVTPRV